MEEVWKDIEGFEGLYQVSSYSRVRSLDWYQTRYSRNGKEYLQLHKGRILKTRLNPKGYPYVNLYKDGVMTSKTLHRNRCKKAGGYHWRYVDEQEKEA